MDGAHTLRLRAHRATRPLLDVPGKEVDVQPARTVRHETLQEERGDDGTGVTAGRHIIDVRMLAREFIVVAGPERHRPYRVMLEVRQVCELLKQLRVVRVRGRQLRPQGNARGTRQSCKIDDEI